MMKPGLARIEFLLEGLGRPQDRFPAVHIAGTNGKGSTAAMIAAVLRAAGLRVGLFTSPHLVGYNERIVVDGEPVGDDDLARLSSRVEPLLAKAAAAAGVGEPTEFEAATAMALAHFADREVDVAVVEVGLGGRLDSTNVVDPVVSVITPVGLDHTAVLGETLPEIAEEKAGILRPGIPLVLARQEPEAGAVIRDRAAELGVAVYEQGVAFDAVVGKLAVDGTTFDFFAPPPEASSVGLSIRGLRTPLVGAHQADNGAAAVAAAALALHRLGRSRLGPRGAKTARGSGPGIGPGTEPGATPGLATMLRERCDVFRSGLAATKWPGRFEIIDRGPLTIVDGAHNVESARALAETIRAVLTRRPLVFVVGMLQEKPIGPMLDTLLPLADAVVFTKPSQGRTPGAEPQQLARTARRLLDGAGSAADAPSPLPEGSAPTIELEPHPASALRRGKALAGPDGVVVLWGSLYLVGEIKGLQEPKQ